MLVFQNRSVARAARKEGLSDEACRKAIDNADRGLIDADLGGGLIKQRIARQGGGKSGGYRSIIFYRRGDLAVMLHLFAKSDKANITATERDALGLLAKEMHKLSLDQLHELVRSSGWREISDGPEGQT
ncbi:MAG: type II toxin-antitoxin system RelE/ParE family toxin [Methylobacteriaceae bacterium]|nr:type II toxin-antitoxin system RelE/ParE family toxin [Rhodoblastus sp.]MCC0003978.1 type II toxin-antitoxin system RelE/ParE family toxin [Methylobacteriaceae bacterium]